MDYLLNPPHFYKMLMKVCTNEPNKMSKNTFLGLDIKISFIVSRGFVQMENQGLSARLN